jgi:hypothetical protein
MLKVSQNTFPLANSQRVIASVASGSIFSPNNNERIRISLDPANIPLLDPVSSYITCDFTLTAPNAQFKFVDDIGCTAMLRDVRVYLGGVVVEEITNLPSIIGSVKSYMDELSVLKLDSLGEGSYQANPLNGLATAAMAPRTVKLCFKPPTGLFGLSSAIPLVAAGNLELEFTLERADKCLVPVDYQVLSQVPLVPSGGGAATNFICGQRYLCVNQVVAAAGNLTTITLAPKVSVVSGVAPPPGTITNAYTGFDTENDCPFSVGMYIMPTNIAAGGTDADERRDIAGDGVQITNVTRIADGLIQLTIAVTAVVPALAANDVGQFVRIARYTDNTTVPTAGYQVTNVNFHANVVTPPAQYLASIPKVMMDGGMSFDIPTFTEILANVPAASTSATVDIPVYVSRGVSMLSVAELGTQTAFRNTRKGEYADALDYQWQFGAAGMRAPNRAVDLSQLADDMVSQEHLRELQKSLASYGKVKDLRQFKNNFVIGRALGHKGASMNMASGGGARLYVNYSAGLPAGGLQFHNFVHHIRSVNISAAGVSVQV